MINTSVTHSVCNPKDVVAPQWYSEAVALISTSKSWKKWSRPVSKKFYARLLEDIGSAFSAMGLEQKALDFFITDTIDYYIDHGTLKPAYSQYVWELGIFHAFKSRIDEAITRRSRAIAGAASRRARLEAAKPSSAPTTTFQTVISPTITSPRPASPTTPAASAPPSTAIPAASTPPVSSVTAAASTPVASTAALSPPNSSAIRPTAPPASG